MDNLINLIKRETHKIINWKLNRTDSIMSPLNDLYKNVYILVILLNLSQYLMTAGLTTSPTRILTNNGGGGGGGGGGGSNENRNDNDDTSNSPTLTKLGVYMLRSPETTVAPQGDEVQFECELNLEPERLDWRFRPQTKIGDNTKNDYIYIHKTVS